jgi:hypothetical protein
MLALMPRRLRKSARVFTLRTTSQQRNIGVKVEKDNSLSLYHGI